MPTMSPRACGTLLFALTASAVCLATSPAEAKIKRFDRTVDVKAMRARAVPMRARAVETPPKRAAAATEFRPPAVEPIREPAGSWTAGEAGAKTCSRNRRMLWQPGEGWMVKRVNVCS